ncbi:MAG: YceD family protein [Endomicrobium sp.]|uniref:YceD family protein n=1 Tax=Candidatus Endomicrobiellum pyrsonymphae TaxID=1408203 RepID=UPI00357DB08B|nr:YceD family protein [Endomicrobium sp.]
MKELIVSLSDFLKTDVIEILSHKYKGDIGFVSDIAVSFKAVKISDGKIRVSGDISGTIELECSRCLRDYSHSLVIPIGVDIDIINGRVDIGEEVRQLLLLEIPMKPLCSEDCQGVCKICGKYNKKNSSCTCIEKDNDLIRIKERWKEFLDKDNRRK